MPSGQKRKRTTTAVNGENKLGKDWKMDVWKMIQITTEVVNDEAGSAPTLSDIGTSMILKHYPELKPQMVGDESAFAKSDVEESFSVQAFAGTKSDVVEKTLSRSHFNHTAVPTGLCSSYNYLLWVVSHHDSTQTYLFQL